MKLSKLLNAELLKVRMGIPEQFDADTYEEIKRWFEMCVSCDYFGLPPIGTHGVYPSCVKIIDGVLFVTFNYLTSTNQ